VAKSNESWNFAKMSVLKFTKMHGLGNDYIYVDCMNMRLDSPAELSRRLSDRHRSVGADGLVLIEPSKCADFRMRVFNADGSEGQMCGNAARCVGKYVSEKGLSRQSVVTLETASGVKRLFLHREGGKVNRVTVDMGCPVFDSAMIPVASSDSKHIEVETNSGTIVLTAVSIGNPHGVVFCESADETAVNRIGPLLESHPVFPKRANIELVDWIGSVRMRMRVWERGSGATLSCGTGACAAVVAGAITGRCGRKMEVEQPGGVLEVDWRETDGRIYLTGPAEISFEGEVVI